jgi:paraquat-inducible protein B
MNRFNPKIIGAFVLGAIILAIGATAVLGTGLFFGKHYEYVLCFPGDISGLRVGAAVRFRGVPIGRVTSIRLNLDQGVKLLTPASGESRLPVTIELNEAKILLRGAQVNIANPEMLDEAIREGLRGQLRLESFVTGIYYVSLNIDPNSKVVLCLPSKSGYKEIPTIPTTLEQAQSTLQRLIVKMEEANVGEMMTNASSAMKRIDELVSSPGLHAAVGSLGGTEQNMSIAARNLGQTALSLTRLANTLNSNIPKMSAALRATSNQTQGAMQNADKTLNSMRTVIEPGSPVVYRMNRALDSVNGAAQSVEALADYLRQNPSALLRGR